MDNNSKTTETMTSKERVLATINFEPTDRPPVFFMEGSSWIIKQEGISFAQQFELPDAGAEGIVRWADKMGSDVISCGAGAWMAWANMFGAEYNATKVGATIDVKPCIKDLSTEIPDLTNEEIRELALNNDLIKTMIKQISEVKKLVGDEKLAVASLTGPFTAGMVLLGANDFVMAIAKKNPDFPRLLSFTARVMAVLADIYREAGADVLMTADPMSSGDMISLKTYKEYAVPAYIEFKDNITDKDLLLFMHICGKAGSRLEDVIDLGARAFSVDAMVDMEEMLRTADHRITMMGNLSPSDQMVMGTPEGITEEAHRLLKLGRENGGGFMLSTGCDLPATSPVENVAAMTKAARDFAL